MLNTCSIHRSIWKWTNRILFICIITSVWTRATTNTHQLETSLTNHWIIKNPPTQKIKPPIFLPQSREKSLYAPTTLLTSHLEYWMSNKVTEQGEWGREREKKQTHSNEQKLLDKTDQSTLRLMKRTPKYYARAPKPYEQNSTIDRHSVAISKINSKCVCVMYFGQESREKHINRVRVQETLWNCKFIETVW